MQDDLLAFAEKAGQVGGVLRSLPEDARMQAVLDVMIAEAEKTSEIEGEVVSRADVVSSIRNQLGLNRPTEAVKDPASRGVGELMVDIRNTWQEELSEEQLLAWHRMLMQGARGVAVGRWRSHAEPMRVVSGSAAHPRVHFEAPPSSRIPTEIDRFIGWFHVSRDPALGRKGATACHDRLARHAIGRASAHTMRSPATAWRSASPAAGPLMPVPGSARATGAIKVMAPSANEWPAPLPKPSTTVPPRW